MTVYDLICLLPILFYGFSGYRKGAFGTIIGFVGLLVSFVIAIVISPAVSKSLMNNPEFYAQVTGGLAKGIVSIASGDSAAANGILSALMGSSQFTILQGLINTGGKAAAATMIAPYVAPYADTLVRVAVVFVLFAALGIVIKALQAFFRKVDDLPVIGFVNRLGGMALNLIPGIILSILLVGGIFAYALFTGQTALLSTLNSGLFTGFVLQIIGIL